MNEAGQGSSLPTTRNAAELAIVTREQQELQAAYIMASKLPRDEASPFEKLKRLCADRTFALAAYYAIDRSGKKADDYDARVKKADGSLRWDKTQNLKGVISGPTIVVAKAIMQCWGRMRAGFMVLSDDGEYFDMKGFAIDLAEVNQMETFGRYRKRIQRKIWKTGTDGKRYSETEWVVPDENQFNELTARLGAKLMRNAILSLVPLYVGAEIKRLCIETLGRDPEGDAARINGIVKMVRSFEKFGITEEMLERRAGGKLQDQDDESLQELWELGLAIKKGREKAEAHFPELSNREAPRSEQPAGTALKTPPAAGATAPDSECLNTPQSAPAETALPPSPAPVLSKAPEPPASKDGPLPDNSAGKPESDTGPAAVEPNPLVKSMLQHYAALGVTPPMLEARVKKPWPDWTDEILEGLLELLEYIEKGQVQPEKEFPGIQK